jgi:hypothetical protein
MEYVEFNNLKDFYEEFEKYVASKKGSSQSKF